MFYSDQTLLDDGEDAEVTWAVPKVWRDAPWDGLQAVVAGDVVYRGQDIYCPLQSGELVTTNDLGPIMRAAGLAKYGLYIPKLEHEAVSKRVKEYRLG
jgi:hypothetical protein